MSKNVCVYLVAVMTSRPDGRESIFTRSISVKSFSTAKAEENLVPHGDRNVDQDDRTHNGPSKVISGEQAVAPVEHQQGVLPTVNNGVLNNGDDRVVSQNQSNLSGLADVTSSLDYPLSALQPDMELEGNLNGGVDVNQSVNLLAEQMRRHAEHQEMQ